MKQIYVLLSVCLFSFFEGIDAFAQSVNFSNIRLEHNVPDNNGRQMLKFNFTVTVDGCLNHKVKFYMYVETPQNQRHRFPNGNEMVWSSNVFEIKYRSSTLSSWLGIYNDQLNPLPGTNTYHTYIMARDETTGRWLGSSSYLDFINTGSQQNVTPSQSNTPTQNQNLPCPNCSGTGRCYACGGKGQYYNNLTGKWYPCYDCVNCNGYCKWCKGSGKFY